MSDAHTPERMTQTTISISEDVADRLYARKRRGESYNDVVEDLLEAAEASAHDEREGVAREPTPEAGDDDTPALDADADVSVAELVDRVAGDVLPGSGAKLEERTAALAAAVEYLREHGEATPSEFKTDVYPEHTARYTDGEDPARSWWKNCIYKGFDELADRTDAIGRADTSGTWSWRAHEAGEA